MDEAKSNPSGCKAVTWTQGMFTLRDEGIKLLAQSLGCDPAKVKVAGTRDVEAFVNGGAITKVFQGLLPTGGQNVPFVCMVGGFTLVAAKSLSAKGVSAQSLKGGIVSLATRAGFSACPVAEAG